MGKERLLQIVSVTTHMSPFRGGYHDLNSCLSRGRQESRRGREGDDRDDDRDPHRWRGDGAWKRVRIQE